jgi:uncharacterized membrane protein
MSSAPPHSGPDLPLDPAAASGSPGRDPGEHGRSARARVSVAVPVGLVAAAVVALSGQGALAPLAGWDAAAAVFVGWTWRSIWPMDAAQTARHAAQEDPSRTATDLFLLIAAVASLLAVGLVIVTAGNKGGLFEGVQVGLGVASVVLSWTVVHTVFTLRYSRLYYSGPDGGIDFNEDDPPRYSDFAYLAFTIGMTFQVSDTDLKTKDIRATALRQALLSYLFGTVIVATTINLIAGLSK